MRIASLFVFAWGFGPALASAKPATVLDGTWEYKFDDSKISKEDVQAALPFAENAPPLVDSKNCPIWKLQSYVDDHGDWAAWSTWKTAWAKEARQAADRELEALKPFEERSVSKELQPVKDFALREQRIHHEIDLATIAVIEQDNGAALAKPFLGIDPGKACADDVAKATAAASTEQKYRAARFGWHNCVLAQQGKFPKTAWKSFLKKYGIRVVHHTDASE